jgi:hypothetical protein
LKGLQPIHPHIRAHSDSGQHFAYIKVFAEGSNNEVANDSQYDPPYSLIEINRDRLKEIERVKAERQTEEYKNVICYLFLAIYFTHMK